MARKVTWGTPGRTAHYLWPRGKWAFVLPAVVLGGGLVALLLLLQAAGVRRPLAPGDVISRHAPIEARCEECHTARRGASDVRCQRCHDPSGAGRLTNGVHVLFGSGDARKAAAAPRLACARCHVEHRGRDARLAAVDEVQCAQCHFRSFTSHPEFAVFRSPSAEAPGLKFGHDSAEPARFAGHLAEVAKAKGIRIERSCGECHQRTGEQRDFTGVSFDLHCASCHAKDGSLGTVDPVPQEDALPPEQVAALGVRGPWLGRADEFQVGRGKVGRSVVHHKDEWVLFNLRKLRREIDPEGWAAERGALLARLSQLQRRLAQATPLASLDQAALRARQQSIEAELRGLDARIAAQATGAPATTGRSRLDEVQAAAAAAGDASNRADARQLQAGSDGLAAAGAPAEALPRDEFEARRGELLAALEAIETADPSLRPRAQDLRRRALALAPGETGLDILQRARDQRQAERQRVMDEQALRAGGIAPPGEALLEPERDAIQRAIDYVQARLAALSEAPAPRATLTPAELQRKKETVEVLTVPCVKCHLFTGAAMARPVAARPVLVRARFEHQPHLLPVQGDCYHCHGAIQKSKVSADLNFGGVQSCRECHKPRSVSQDCQTCHRYHPPAVP
jgi:hypothetical protein